MVETAQLTEILKEKMGITDAMLSGGFGFGGGGAPAAGGAAGGQASAAAAAEEPKKEKTEFTLKLESFNAADKLKVGCPLCDTHAFPRPIQEHGRTDFDSRLSFSCE
jgi:large subunit ribosomal protein L7/L12